MKHLYKKSKESEVLWEDAIQEEVLYSMCTETQTYGYGHGPVPGWEQSIMSLLAEVCGSFEDILSFDGMIHELETLIDNKAQFTWIHKY